MLEIFLNSKVFDCLLFGIVIYLFGAWLHKDWKWITSHAIEKYDRSRKEK